MIKFLLLNFFYIKKKKTKIKLNEEQYPKLPFRKKRRK